MSKKNKHSNPWRPAVGRASSPARLALARDLLIAPVTDPAPLDLSPISPAQLAANRANALLSTGPCTEAGKAASSKNAVKSALTGRTVLLPTDDVEEYACCLDSLRQELKPAGKAESELVQIIADCFWRLRRIQTLEHALYAHGHEQFENAFPGTPEEERYSKILLQTYLTYQKELRNLHIHEARLDRKRAKALAELQQLQSERNEPERESEEAEASGAAPFASEADFFAALDAGYVPPYLAAHVAQSKHVNENGFVFSNESSGQADLA